MFYLPLFCLICLWGLKCVIKPMIVDYLLLCGRRRLSFNVCYLQCVQCIVLASNTHRKIVHWKNISMERQRWRWHCLLLLSSFFVLFGRTKNHSMTAAGRKYLEQGILEFGIRNENEWLEICLMFIRSIFLFGNSSLFYYFAETNDSKGNTSTTDIVTAPEKQIPSRDHFYDTMWQLTVIWSIYFNSETVFIVKLT